MASLNLCSRSDSTVECNQVFEIEQCLYNLSDDFTRQTSLSEESYSTDSPSSPIAEEFIKGKPPRVMHSFGDILKHPISDEVLDQLCFTEVLLVCDGTKNVVGGAAINVSLIADEVLAAFSSTRLSFPGQSAAESELMSFADRRSCRPLQERKRETLLSGNTRQEKQIQLYFDEHQNVTAYRQECNGLHTDRFQGMLRESGNAEEERQQMMLLPDGLQLLLLRYLVLINFVGEICSQTVDIQGRVGNCVHKLTAAVPITKQTGDKLSESVKEVRKIIQYPGGSESEESISYYSTTGRLLRHSWTNSKYLLISNPLGRPPSPVGELERNIKEYVQALTKLIRNRLSISSIIDDIECSVKGVRRLKNIVNPLLADIIKDL
ncbi:uncharacterized protein LOC128272486 [Anopheles cruzii]|uniref:uncharacterized protein LOC128272486 n=1 Tax=Anopheles cruzii TaxID=68878 RepID=UPI0022EC2B2D|nr:uncharacterized protein LOC128272486 [Anopheles cruzii]